MNIFILGSDGQIGKPLVRYLKNLNNNVIEFDIFSNTNNDLRISQVLDEILPQVNFVFFLAFDVGGSLYLNKYQNTYDFISNNVKIMNNTFDSLKKYKTPFIFASSQMADMNYSTYGTLKRIGEKYTQSLNGIVVKFWNIYGFEKDLNKSHVITDFILMAKNQGAIKMKTNGEESRQFLYVDDCCKCLNILMNKYNEIDAKSFDISSFEWIKIIDIAEIISKQFNDYPIYKGENIDDVQRNALKEPNKYILNFWQPETKIEDGIKKIIELIDNEN